jgi:prepilin-type N-terminal cleavage/methylation domain-containing protein
MKSERVETRGFSLIELLIVVVIALLLMAIALPALMGYFRFAKIRGAAREVSEEIERARYRAINRNVNLGVVFIVLDETHYRVAVEDDLQPGVGTDWTIQNPQSWATLTSGSLERVQARPQMTLPMGVRFYTDDCTGPGDSGSLTDVGFRFNRLGRPCAFSETTCDSAPSGVPDDDFVVTDAAAGMTVCMEEIATGFTTWVSVSPGGRVRTRQGFE